jgi:tRNA 2-selenouridine synthase
MSAARPPEGAQDAAHGRPKPRREQLPTQALAGGSAAAKPQAWGDHASAPLPPGPPPRPEYKVPVEALPAFIDRIDVRTPSEFAEDHVPGAVNWPVLDDDERARVGTMYVQVSAFDARKIGAALVARRIADIVEHRACDKPREWQPVVYCWRGGQRSRSLVHVLCEVGWRAAQLDGGYRAYRRHVVASLATSPQQFEYRLVCGLTGCGKSRLLAALCAAGAQVLDLEGIARHRGSLLGDLPDAPQPSQKFFESELFAALSSFDHKRVVYVESESRKIGTVQIPDALLAAMRASPCLLVETPKPLRVALLKDEYEHFLTATDALSSRLARLLPVHGKKTIERWTAMAESGDHPALIDELLTLHYDPMYTRSIDRNFPLHRDATVAEVRDISAPGFATLAHDVLARAMRAEPAAVLEQR